MVNRGAMLWIPEGRVSERVFKKHRPNSKVLNFIFSIYNIFITDVNIVTLLCYIMAWKIHDVATFMNCLNIQCF